LLRRINCFTYTGTFIEKGDKVKKDTKSGTDKKNSKKAYKKPEVDKKENLKEITLLSFTPPSS